MEKDTDIYQGRNFDKFIVEEREKNIRLMRWRYSLSQQEAEDMVSEAIADLYMARANRRDDRHVTSLAAYFTKICLNKCYKYYGPQTGHDEPKARNDDDAADIEAERINSYLDSAAGISDEAAALMRKIVAQLPAPCDKILWAYYEDGLNMKEIAALTGLKDERSAKSTKSNCISKLKTRYINTLQKIKNGEI